MKKKIIIAAISLVMLVGCNEVPEDVKSRAEEQWRPIPEEHKELIQYIPLGEMQADIDKALTDTYANFDLREGIKVRLPDQLRQCDFAQVDGFASNAEKVLDAFIDSSDRKGIAIETYEQEAVLDNPHTKTTCRGFRDEDGKRQFIVWENGFVSMFRGAMFDLQLSSPETIKIYHVDRGDDLSDSYKLDKETLTVKEAVDKAQKWIDEPEVSRHGGEVKGDGEQILNGLFPRDSTPCHGQESIDDHEQQHGRDNATEAVEVEAGHGSAVGHGGQQKGRDHHK